MTDVLITAVELADLLKTEPCVIVDTRNPDAYAAGHLPNAVNVHEMASASPAAATTFWPCSAIPR